MAYLKGGSVVDGNLYIEGGLVVRNISTSAGGKLPTLDDGDTKTDRLVKFKNYNGGLEYSSFGETTSGKKVNLYVGEEEGFDSLGLSFGNTNPTDVFTITKGNTTEIEKIDINTSASKIMVEDRGIIDDENSTIDIKNFDVTKNRIPESFSYSAN